jgi:hypothetical protein
LNTLGFCNFLYNSHFIVVTSEAITAASEKMKGRVGLQGETTVAHVVVVCVRSDGPFKAAALIGGSGEPTPTWHM